MKIETIIEIRNQYKKWGIETPMTKKALCELMIPLRDKYHLTDREVLGIARNEFSIEEMASIGDKK